MALDINEEFKVINLLASTLVAADRNGTGLDLEQYDDNALVILSTGQITSTAATYAVNIQGSTALNGDYSTIASFSVFNGTAMSYKTAALKVRIDGPARKYVRAQVDTTANAGTVSAIIGATVLVRPLVAGAGQNSDTLA